MLQAIDLPADPAEPAGQSEMFVTEGKGSFCPNENNQAPRCIRWNILHIVPDTINTDWPLFNGEME